MCLSCSGCWRSLGGGGGLVGVWILVDVWILVGVWFWWVFGCLGLLGLFHTVTTTVLKMVGVPTTSSRLGLYILTKRDGGPQTPTNPSELRRSLCVVPGPTPQTGRHDKVKAGQELTEGVKLFLSDPAGPALFLGQAEAAALVSISPTRTPITLANKEPSHP